MLYNIILCYTTFYIIVLYYVFCIVLYYTILHYAILYYTILYDNFSICLEDDGRSVAGFF